MNKQEGAGDAVAGMLALWDAATQTPVVVILVAVVAAIVGLNKVAKESRDAYHNGHYFVRFFRNPGKGIRAFFKPPAEKTDTFTNSPAPIADQFAARPTIEQGPGGIDPKIPTEENVFEGRDDVFTDLARRYFPNGEDLRLTQSGSLGKSVRLVLQGGQGLGKTTTAARFARKHSHAFRAVHWLRAQDGASLSSDAEDVARLYARDDQSRTGLGAIPTDAAYLIVFDNAEDEDCLAPYLRQLPSNVRVLITSKWSAWSLAEPIALKPLSPQDALAVLCKAAQRSVKDVEAPARELVARLGGIPMLLNGVGKYCQDTGLSFGECLKKIDAITQGLKDHNDSSRLAMAVLRLSIDQAARRSHLARDLADFISYCAPEGIPRSLIDEAFNDQDPLETGSAIAALRSVGLISLGNPYSGDDASFTMHRWYQDVIRIETDAGGRSPDVVARLARALRHKLHGPFKGDRRPLGRYVSHLVRTMHYLDTPDFRGTSSEDLDSLATLLVDVISLSRAELTKGGHVPEYLPSVLGCFYEIDPLADVLDYLLDNTQRNWPELQHQLLAQNNYVLRFAMAEALAKRARKYPHVLDKQITPLVRIERPLNEFELGGYALKAVYSSATFPRGMDRRLLQLLASHPCYPGRSILCDLFLNLALAPQTPATELPLAILPPGTGPNNRLWQPVWDFISDDVAMIQAAAARMHGQGQDELSPQALQALRYLDWLDGQRKQVERNLASAKDPLSIVSRHGYFALGQDTDAILRAHRQFGLQHVDGLFALLFGHPVWSVAEAGAHAFSDAYHRTDPGNRDRLDEVLAFCLKSDEWRVRYGAIEAAFQIRGDDGLCAFQKAVRESFAHPVSKVRGLCAENLFAVISNSNDETYATLTKAFDTEIGAWLKDEDCWVLEHVYRFANRAHRELRVTSIVPLLERGVSRLMDGRSEWLTLEREAFLELIETKKEGLRSGLSG